MHGRITSRARRKQRGAVLRVMCLSLMMVVAAGREPQRRAARDRARHRRDADAAAVDRRRLRARRSRRCCCPRARSATASGASRSSRSGWRSSASRRSAAMFVDSPGALIALRALMGVGAAFVMPVTLSVITTIFPPEERGKAVGTWVGVAAGGGVLGLLVSGVLLEWLSWPAIFGLNVVLATLALAGTLAVVPATREARPPRLDPIGTLLSVVALAALVFGIIEGAERGWGEPGDARRARSAASPGSPRSSSGSCAAATRCSTRATSCAAASAPARSRSRCSSSPRSASSSWRCRTSSS